MFGTVCFQREQTLVTTGDAVAWWLDEPDDATSNHCLLSAKDVEREKSAHQATHRTIAHHVDRLPVVLQSRAINRVYHTIRRRRWITLYTLSITTLIIAGFLLYLAYTGLADYSSDPIQATGFGAFHPSALTAIGSSYSNAVKLVLIANTPQLIFSCLYFIYNGLITSMCQSHEYSSYAIQRQPLRVSSPQGEQKSTYRLNLPYIFGVPLLIASAILHWTISQSIFFVAIDVYETAKPEPSYNHVGLGFSIAPIICDIVLGSSMLLGLGVLAYRRLHCKIPLAGSNSMAISAACHRPKEDADAATKSIMWGEVEKVRADSEVGHCTFTSMEVITPVEGKLYAGS